MKFLHVLLFSISCGYLLSSCNEVEPLRVKTNYQTLSPKAKYLGECTALYNYSTKVLVKIEYDNSKIMLNRSVAGNGIRENTFYNKSGEITKFESFLNDVPERIYTAEYNEHGDVIKQYEMNQRSGEIVKMNNVVQYKYEKDTKIYSAIVAEDGEKILRITQVRAGDSIVRIVESLTGPTPIISQKETEIYENGLLKSKITYGLNSNFIDMTMEPGTTRVTYEYNKEGQRIKEKTTYPVGAGQPETVKIISYTHGLLSAQSKGSQEREQYKLFRLEYSDN